MKALAILLILILPISAGAAELEEVLLAAQQGSRDAESYRLSYENSLLSLRSDALDESASYSLELEASPLSEGVDGISVGSLSFTAVTPDEDTSVSVRSPFTIMYDGSGSTYYPGFSVSHSFDFGHDDELLKDLQIEASRISTERTYRSALLSMQRSVLDISASIYSIDLEIEEEERSLEKARREMEEDLELRIISAGSVDAVERDLSIRLSEDNIASLERQKEILAGSFQALTGLEWEPYSSIPEPSFASIYSWDGNSEVEEARLLSEVAGEAYLVEYSEQHPRQLSLSLDADGTIRQKEGMEADEAGAMATVGWDSGNWALYVSGGGRWQNAERRIVPSITIGGSWHSDSTGRKDALYLETLANERLLRQNEYMITLSDYREDLVSVLSDIAAWQASRERQGNEIEYRKAVASQAEAFYSKGLMTEEELSDAAFALHKAEAELGVMKLEGLSLSLSLESLMI